MVTKSWVWSKFVGLPGCRLLFLCDHVVWPGGTGNRLEFVVLERIYPFGLVIRWAGDGPVSTILRTFVPGRVRPPFLNLTVLPESVREEITRRINDG